MKIAVLGRKETSANYENYIRLASAEPIVSLCAADLSECDALILPGGGDITPAFFGERNSGSVNIDTELDILQIQALDLFLEKQKPILGICKGMQLINIVFGGNVIQHLKSASVHSGVKDLYHSTTISESSCLYELYGKSAFVNSAHHQAVGRIGKGLCPIQWCDSDGCVEAIVHESLPILGLQWHPERLLPSETPLEGLKILNLLSNWIMAKHSLRTIEY